MVVLALRHGLTYKILMMYGVLFMVSPKGNLSKVVYGQPQGEPRQRYDMGVYGQPQGEPKHQV